MSLISWEDLAKRPVREPEFFLDPFIVKEGITLLWAGTSIGKSPLTWHMAKSVGEGTHFFGLPAKAGKVLYIELDTPEVAMVPRLHKMAPAQNVWWLFHKPLAIPSERPERLEALNEAQAEVKPDVVFINTLRKCHDMDDKDSRTPKIVYSFFQYLFPQAALVFVHHERKKATDPRALAFDKEDFSGSMHWLDDAQAGLQLQPFKGPRENLRLYHRKSQVSETLVPLPLLLGEDGTTLSSPLFEDLLKVYDFVNERPEKGGDLDIIIAGSMNMSTSTARRRRLLIEEGHFPGSRRFLARARLEEQ